MSFRKWSMILPLFKLIFGWILIKICFVVIKESIRMSFEEKCLDAQVDDMAITTQTMQYQIILDSLFCKLFSDVLKYCIIVTRIIAHKITQTRLNTILLNYFEEHDTQIFTSMLSLY